MAEALEPRLTYAEYLAAEEVALEKHDFVAGEVYAMAGGTLEHQRIASQMLGELYVVLRGASCRAVNSDQRIRIAAADLSCYPDVTVVYGQDERAPDDRNALVNPRVVVEVLCKSTEAHDRGMKFAALRELSSLQEYVLLHQERQLAEVFTRQADGRWLLAFHETSLPLRSLEVAVDLGAVYEGVFPGEAEPSV